MTRVVHVTEAMTAGVLTLVSSLSRRQADAGAVVAIAFLRRPDTPPFGELRRLCDPRVELIEIGGAEVRGLLNLVRYCFAVTRSGAVDVVHLHSSIAGSIGRAVSPRHGQYPSVFYSPHGFAFLRLNKSRASRWIVKMIERILCKLPFPLILTSQSELSIARDVLRSRHAYYLQTGVPKASIPAGLAQRTHARPTIVMVGRIAYQKAPWRFAQVASALNSVAVFTWIGDGDANFKQLLEDANVSIHPWVPIDQLNDLLDSADLILFPSLWEGMSLGLIQGVARGLPAVVSDAPGNRDAVVDGVTGYVCQSVEEMMERCRRLVDDPELRQQMGVRALEWSRQNLTDDQIGVDSLNIYESASVTGGRPPRSIT